MTLTYDPGVFRVGDLAQAKGIILTPEASLSTEERWSNETGYLAELIDSRLQLNPASVVVDYGCGIGRIAKELIERTGCSVLGVDISPDMRSLAVGYVNSDRFSTCSPEMLDSLLAAGLRADAAISIWVLQHCLQPAVDVERIGEAVKPDGMVFIVNNRVSRAVPTVEQGWVDDGLDLRELLAAVWAPKEEGRLAPEKTNQAISDNSFWALYRRP